MARTTYLTAPCDGRLAILSVQEGDAVRIGDPILELHDETLERTIAQKTLEIAALESELQKTLASAELELNWRVRTLESEICEIQLKSAAFLKEQYNFEMQQSMLSDVLAGQEFAMVGDDPQALLSSLKLEDHLNHADRMTTMLEMELASNAAEVSSAQVEICELRQQQLAELNHRCRLTFGERKESTWLRQT